MLEIIEVGQQKLTKSWNTAIIKKKKPKKNPQMTREITHWKIWLTDERSSWIKIAVNSYLRRETQR